MMEEAITLPPRGPLFEAIGRGITAFTLVEFGVGMCFASMLEPAPRRSSITVINSARSFEAKMKMANALAEVALPADQLERWRSLSCRITKRKEMRDRLAHWMVSHHPGATTTEEAKRMQPALVPPIWAKGFMEVAYDKAHQSRAIRKQQVLTFVEKTHELGTELLKFGTQISERKA